MVLHPDFNIANGHYENVEFKPVIARYDWDQTYDILEFVYLPHGFDRLFNLCGIPAFELLAIDRFTPYNYLWANEYSNKLSNFIQTFNFSPFSTINFTRKNTANYLGSIIKTFEQHPNWKGIWTHPSVYVIDDVVFYNGLFYQCINPYSTPNNSFSDGRSNWQILFSPDYAYDDTRLTKFNFIEYSYKEKPLEFVALSDTSFNSPPVDDDGNFNTPDWLCINEIIPDFEYSSTINNFFDLSVHPKFKQKWRRQDYKKGEIVEWQTKYYITKEDLTYSKRWYKPLSYFIEPYFTEWDQTDTQEFQLENIVLYHNGNYYMPLVENATLPLWEDREQPPPEPDNGEWTSITFMSYKANFPEGEYQITALIYDGWQEGLVGSIPTINQVFFNLKVGKNGKEFDLNKLLLKWSSEGNLYCANSIVISKKDPQGGGTTYTPSITNKPTWLLFDDFDLYFNGVKQKILTFDSTIQKYIEYTNNGSIWKQFPTHLTNYYYLQFANNNKWKTGVVNTDLGYNPSCFIDNQFLHLKQRQNYTALHELSNLERKIRDAKSRFDLPPLVYSLGSEFKSNDLYLKQNSYDYGYYGYDFPDYKIFIDSLWGYFIKNLNFALFEFNFKDELEKNKYFYASVQWGNYYYFTELDSQNILREYKLEIEQKRDIYYMLSDFTFYDTVNINALKDQDLVFLPFIKKTKYPFVGQVTRIALSKNYQIDEEPINDIKEVYYTGEIEKGFINDNLIFSYTFIPNNDVSAIKRVSEDKWISHTLWNENEWISLSNYSSIPDTTYLNYLKQLKLEYEELSKTW